MTKSSIRLLLSKHRSLLLPVAHDALTAKLIKLAGFQAFSIGGFGVAASAFGKPDNGSVGFEELFPIFSNILRASSLPALVDADTGYGGPRRTAKVVNAYEKIGEKGPGKLSEFVKELQTYLPRKIDLIIFDNAKLDKKQSQYYYYN